MADRNGVRKASGRGKMAGYLCVAGALLVSGCARSVESGPHAVVSGSPTGSSGGSATSGGPVGPDNPGPATPGRSAAAVPDGRSAGILARVDLGAGTVTFDPVVVLTGDAMKRYLKAHPDAADPYYSPGYIVVDDGPALRTLPLAATVSVKVIDLDSGNNATHAIRLADLPAHLRTSGYHEQDGQSAFPYYLTVLHGQITALQELGVA